MLVKLSFVQRVVNIILTMPTISLICHKLKHTRISNRLQFDGYTPALKSTSLPKSLRKVLLCRALGVAILFIYHSLVVTLTDKLRGSYDS